MAKEYDELDERLQQFILNQKLFFVASAPRSDDGLINISPKGLDTLRILDSKSVAYLDLTGSGVESIAHIRENRRFVMMFCSFDRTPMILRLHGRGRVIERSDAEWSNLQPLFPDLRGTRSIIHLSIHRIADSCGWAVPMFEFVQDRDQYSAYMKQATDDEIRNLQLESNLTSLDGLPALTEPTSGLCDRE